MKTLPLVLLALAGCDLLGTVRPSGRPVSDAYTGPAEMRVLDVDSPLRPQKHLPVLAAPEVFAAYVASHAGKDVLIGDHWIFFKLREAEWFTERFTDPDPPADGDASPESMQPLRALDGSRAVVPHRN